jgi:hypothetical protein
VAQATAPFHQPPLIYNAAETIIEPQRDAWNGLEQAPARAPDIQLANRGVAFDCLRVGCCRYFIGGAGS